MKVFWQLKLLKKLNYKVQVKDVRVNNIIASSHCHFKIAIESIQYDPEYKKFVNYNPEVFPGLRVEIPNLPVRANVFASGKISFMGATKIDELEKAADYIFQMAKLHERQDTDSLPFDNMPSNNIENDETVKKEIIKKEKMKKDPFFGRKPKT